MQSTKLLVLSGEMLPEPEVTDRADEDWTERGRSTVTGY